jgi:hypothetical protein
MGKCEPNPSVIGYRLVTRAVMVKQFVVVVLVAMMFVVVWDVIVM